MKGSGIYVFKEKMKRLKSDLKVWNREVFDNVFQQGEDLQRRIQELDEKDDESELDETGREERKWLLAEQRRNSHSQEVILRQKAHLRWLKQGDLNTKYFHSVIKWRRVRNGLYGLRNKGQWYEEQSVVKEKVRDFYEQRFSEDDSQRVRLDNARFNSISDEDNVLLVGRISEEEVKRAMWICDSDKSPGPYGFNFGFIKFCWEEIKDDIIRAIHFFEDEGRWPRGTNASFITLITKVDNPQHLNDFRLISLVRCL